MAIALHQMAANADHFYVRQTNEDYQLVHRNTGRVPISAPDLILFTQTVRSQTGWGLMRVSNMVRNKKKGWCA